MRIADLLGPEHVLDELSGSKAEILAALAEPLGVDGMPVKQELLRMKYSGSTSQEGFAMPFVELPDLTRCSVVFGRAREPIDVGAPDGIPIRLFAGVFGPAGLMRMRGFVAQFFRPRGFRDELVAARDSGTFVRSNDVEGGEGVPLLLLYPR